MRNSVHGRLRQFIVENSRNLRQFSTKCDIPYRTLQDYLAGNIVPGGENLIKMSTVFRMSINWLLTGEGQMYIPVGGATGVYEAQGSYLKGRHPQVKKIAEMVEDMDEEGRQHIFDHVQSTQRLLSEVKKGRI